METYYIEIGGTATAKPMNSILHQPSRGCCTEIRITQVTNVITLGYPGLSLNLRITGDVTFFQITQSGLRSWGYVACSHDGMAVRCHILYCTYCRNTVTAVQSLRGIITVALVMPPSVAPCLRALFDSIAPLTSETATREGEPM